MSSNPEKTGVKLDAMPNFAYGVWRERKEIDLESKPSLTTLVTGPDRCKYFAQPNRNKTKPVNKLEAIIVPSWLKTCLKPDPPLMACATTQTDYRESETQTDPWDTPYRVTGKPEILTLRSLTYGRGLPVDQRTVEDLERAREMRMIEESYQMCENEDQRAEQYHMLVNQKLKEMNVTLSDVRSQHIAQLADVQESLKKDISDREDRRVNILERMWEVKKDDLANKTSKLHEQFEHSVHTLNKKRLALTTETDHPTIDPLSEVDVSEESTTHIDYPVKKTRDPTEDNFYLSDPKGLVELERWMWEEQKIMMEPEIHLPKADALPVSLPKEFDDSEHEVPAENEETSLESKNMLGNRLRPCPFIPTVSSVPPDDLLKEYSTVVLQRTIRGRAMQKEVRAIEAKYAVLIQELRGTQPWTEEEQLVIKEEKEQKHLEYVEERNKAYKDKDMDEVISRFEGDVMVPILNFLGKTADRYLQMKDVLRIVSIAKEQRRRREAEEAGRRQRELVEREVVQQILNEVTTSQEAVVDKFIDDVIESID